MGHLETKPLPHRFYGRRVARTLSPRLKDALEKLLPHYRFGAQTPLPLHLDIGFGSGDSVRYWRAVLPPEQHILGAEPFLNGVAAVLRTLSAENCPRTSLFAADVRLLLPDLPKNSISSCSILFPDPWPKERHEARRLVTTTFLEELRARAAAGATLYLASDAPAYADAMRAAVDESGWTLEIEEQTEAPSFLPDLKTRYQEKALRAGRIPVYFRAVNATAAAAYPDL